MLTSYAATALGPVSFGFNVGCLGGPALQTYMFCIQNKIRTYSILGLAAPQDCRVLGNRPKQPFKYWQLLLATVHLSVPAPTVVTLGPVDMLADSPFKQQDCIFVTSMVRT